MVVSFRENLLEEVRQLLALFSQPHVVALHLLAQLVAADSLQAECRSLQLLLRVFMDERIEANLLFPVSDVVLCRFHWISVLSSAGSCLAYTHLRGAAPAHRGFALANTSAVGLIKSGESGARLRTSAQTAVDLFTFDFGTDGWGKIWRWIESEANRSPVKIPANRE